MHEPTMLYSQGTHDRNRHAVHLPVSRTLDPPFSASQLHPKHPERVCWGCERHCPENDLACGNGSERTPHPLELFGDDWHEWSGSLVRHESASAPASFATSARPIDLAVLNVGQLRRVVADVLSKVIDPGSGVNIVDLGLVRAIRIDAGFVVEVDLTTTEPHCWCGEQIAFDAEDALCAALSIDTVDVELVSDPPWSPEWMSDAARLALANR